MGFLCGKFKKDDILWVCANYTRLHDAGITDADKSETAFTTRQYLKEFNVLLSALCNAPAAFHVMMERILNGLHWNIYLSSVFGRCNYLW